MNRIYKLAALAISAALLCMPAGLAEGEVLIQLGAEQITVNGAVLTEENNSGVALQQVVEAHEDVSEDLEGLSNRVITITEGGTYRVSGAAQDAQIRVEAGEDASVRVILDGADISCRTAPAIAVLSARDSRQEGQYAVTIELAQGSSNTVTGAHTEAEDDDEIKLSGAITSLVSLGFEGDGFLNVDGDNEGIEVKFGHMTFNGGNITVNSGDDPLNASEDNVSVITVNDGTLHLQVKPDKGGEGDGMDSNGAIVINGGAISAYAHPDSQDSGIDSDMGCTINGGVVLGAGNMYDEISAESAQPFMALQFAQKVEDMIVVTDASGAVAAVAHLPGEGGYTSFVLSSPDLKEGDYFLYLGGELTLQDGEMVYTPGTQLQHGGMGGMMGPGGMNQPDMQRPQGMGEGMEKPDGMPRMPEGMEIPEGMEKPEGMEMPEGMEKPDGMQPPQMGEFTPGDRGQGGGRMPGFGGDNNSAEVSTVFSLTAGGTMFSGISEVE